MSPEISERSFEEAIECGLLQHGPDACVGDVSGARPVAPPTRPQSGRSKDRVHDRTVYGALLVPLALAGGVSLRWRSERGRMEPVEERLGGAVSASGQRPGGGERGGGRDRRAARLERRLELLSRRELASVASRN